MRAARLAADREAAPSLAIVDSQSLRLAPRIFECRDTDGGKLVNSRKRQLLVDADGRMLAAHVHAANEADTRAALAFAPALRAWKQRLRKVLTDAGYRGAFARHLRAGGLRHEVASRPPTTRGFVPIKRRWVVERTFAWLTFFRRLSHDREHTPASHETWIYLANLTLCLNQLTATG